MKLVSLLALTCAASAAAQTVNSQDCLANKLLTTQPDSVVVQFNDKIIKLLVTPETEIWRRGVDLTSPEELVTGDNIYVKCANKPAPDGTPIATILAAVHQDSGVDLEPHHIAEITACLGRLSQVGSDTLTVQNDKGSCTLRIPPGTDIWRGEIYHDTSVLRTGDEVGVRAHISYPSGESIADYIEANVVKTEGEVVSVKHDRVVVKDAEWGRVTVFIDSRTKCDGCSAGDLKKGTTILATGLRLTKGNFRGSYITIEQSPGDLDHQRLLNLRP